MSSSLIEQRNHAEFHTYAVMNRGQIRPYLPSQLLKELNEIVLDYILFSSFTSHVRQLSDHFARPGAGHFEGIIVDRLSGQICFPEFASIFQVRDRERAWERRNKEGLAHLAPLNPADPFSANVLVGYRGIIKAIDGTTFLSDFAMGLDGIHAATSDPHHEFLFIVGNVDRERYVGCVALRLQAPLPQIAKKLTLDPVVPRKKGEVAISANDEAVCLLCVLNDDLLHMTIWHRESLSAVTTVIAPLRIKIQDDPRVAVRNGIVAIVSNDRNIIYSWL